MLATLVMLSGLVACASAENERTAYDRNVISEQELRNLEERTPLLQAVERLRPAWLRGRGSARIQGEDGTIVIYVNNQRVGGPNTLTRWVSSEVRELHYLDAMAATQRFGTGHVYGAILVMLR